VCTLKRGVAAATIHRRESASRVTRRLDQFAMTRPSLFVDVLCVPMRSGSWAGTPNDTEKPSGVRSVTMPESGTTNHA